MFLQSSELVQKIEKVMDEYLAGCRNTEARTIIESTIWEIRHRVGRMEGYRLGESGQEVLVDHGYVSEKLSSLNEAAGKLYSQAGSVDAVKSQAMGDCSLLRNYFERPWAQAFDWRHPAPRA